MKIEIPKVVVAVPMSAYHAALEGKFLHVWVNPPQKTLREYDALVTDLQAQELENARKVFDETVVGESRSTLQMAFDQAAGWLRVRKADKTEGISRAMLEWFATLWSQGATDTHWTADELRTLESQDPAFLSWMITQTWAARAAHIEQKKKA